MVSTIKFSEFAAANLNDSTNKSVGLSGGANASTEIVVRWTTSTRPSAPFNGILGYNTDLSQYEYWDSVTMDWFQLGTGDTGTVTLVNTGTGLTGGPITDTGTISFASIAAKSLWANVTSGAAVPTVVALTALVNEILPTTTTPRQMLQSQNLAAPVWSTTTWPATSTINQILYSSSNNVIGEIATAANAVMSTSAGGLPGFSTTLPSNLITTDPVLTQGIATKHYVDQTALNGTSVYAASAASLGTVTQSGAGVGATLTNAGVQATFALDGVNPPAGSNVLIKNTATGMTAANEGIYTVVDVGSAITNWSLVRATGYDTATEINNTGLILVQNGSTLAGTAWYNATTIVTVDTTAFSFSQFGNIIFPVSLANGGTSASLVANNGGIFYSTALSGAILAGTATARQMLQSGATAPPAWSTATYPATTTINRILYSSANNVISEISTVVSAGLLTDGSGVPAWVTATGTGAPVLGTAPTISAPLINQINDQTFNLKVAEFTGVASAVNYIQLGSAATAGAPFVKALGSDTNIDLDLAAKGTGAVVLVSRALTAFVAASAASAVNYVQVASTATGVGPTITATGTDADIYLHLISKGSAGVVLQSNGAAVINAANPASAVNYMTMVGSATGTSPGIVITGTDTNIGMVLVAKGTGGFAISNAGGSSNILSLNAVASAVNYFSMLGNTAGSNPALFASGSDTNITLQVQGKGTGGVYLVGVSTNSLAVTGQVGEIFSAANTTAAPIVFTTGVAKTLQSITLTPGDWIIWGNIFWSGTTVTTGQAGINTTTNTMPNNSLTSYTAGLATSSAIGMIAPMINVQIAANTTYYLVGVVTGTGTLNGSGGIYARRMR